ncbi:hypothetical protein GE09DRAFT_1251817 [Coniochaeta sp. 2T2.1]|nr:hypothetical protein GE09DRAFT_1251817 [Coniochaeta sp. 2T2.1]
MSFLRDASPTPSGSGLGPAIRNPPMAFRNYNGQTTNDRLQPETASFIPPLQASRPTAAARSTDQSLSTPALPQPQPRHQTRRLLPNPPKRARYSLDDVTFQLGKIRVNKAGQAHINVIPPDSDNDDLERGSGERVVDYYKLYSRSIGWDKHLDHGAFASLPGDLQHSLREVMTTRTVSQRKASERMERELRVVSTSLPDSVPDAKPKFDIIGTISSSIEILQAVGKHLRPRDIVNLYSISRDFHAMLDTHMRSSVFVWASHNSRLAMDVFPYQFYVGSTVSDPAGRPRDRAYHDIYARLTATPYLPSQLLRPSSSSSLGSKGEEEVRAVPSLRYLHLLHARTTRVRDILACLARRGHRLPPGTDATLMKLWLIMDLPTNIDRCTVIKTQSYFTKLDLRRASVFLVKLLMRFNDPLYGPDHSVLMELMLGQKGLTPLWELLRGKGYTTLNEIVGAKMRYDVRPTPAEMETGKPVLGVPVDEMAAGHREGGWGGGRAWEEGWDKGTREHLMRPDELVVRECARRGMEMEEYVDSMAVYGHVDLATAENLAPAEEEVYMSDEELPPELGEEDVGRKRWLVYGGGGNVSFKDGEWDMKAIRKSRWDELSEETRQAIKEDDKDEQLRSLVWEEETREDASDESDTTVTGLDEEETWEEQLNNQVEANNTNFDIKGKGKMAHDDDDYEQEDPFDTDSLFGSPPFSPSLSSSASDISISSDESDIFRPPSRVASFSSTMMLPELDHHNQSSSSRITSFNSVATAIRTPSYRGSPSLVGIHSGGDMMDVDGMDVDDQEGESSMLAGGGSSMTVTPLKWASSPNLAVDDASFYGDDQDGDEGYEEDSEGDGSEAEDDDEDLKAQADDYYSEDELEYDWDAWKEQASVVIQGRDDGSEEEAEDEEDDEEVREYHRLY